MYESAWKSRDGREEYWKIKSKLELLVTSKSGNASATKLALGDDVVDEKEEEEAEAESRMENDCPGDN